MALFEFLGGYAVGMAIAFPILLVLSLIVSTVKKK